MISKVIAHGKDRKEAINNLAVGLKNYHLHGIKTNLAFLVSLLQNKNFVANKIDTHFIEGHLPELLHAISKQKHSIPKEVLLAFFLLVMKDTQTANSVWKEIGYWRIHRQRTIVLENEQFVIEDTQIQGNKLHFTLANSVVVCEFIYQKDHKYSIKLKGKLYQGVATINLLNKVYLQIEGHTFILDGKDNLKTKKIFRERNHPSGNFDGNVLAPMPGKVIEVNVRTGETVKPNTKLLVLEAMKMENQISSPINGKVTQINVKRDDRVESGQHLITIELLKTDQANNQKVNDT